MTHVKRHLNSLAWGSAVLALAAHRVAYAQDTFKRDPNCTDPTKICNPLGDVKTLEGLVEVIITLALRIGVPIAALMIIYSGFLFVTARGDVKQIETAKTNFFWTVVGSGILLGAFTIVKLLQGTIDDLR